MDKDNKKIIICILLALTLILSACADIETATQTNTANETITKVQTITITDMVTSTITENTTRIPPEDGFARITCEEVFQMMSDHPDDWYNYFFAIDVRSRVEGWNGRLLNVRNIPNVNVTGTEDSYLSLWERQEELKSLLKDVILVFYDQGEEATAADLAQQLVDLNEELDLGFDVKNIRILEGGFDRWQVLSYPIDYD
jgi:hypothetical protein